MITIVYVTNTTLDADNMREVKVSRLGVDTQTPAEVAPWGYDGNPVDDVSAAFAETVEKGAPVLLGYFIKEQKAARGETRLFATNAAGAVQTQLWLHADGTVQLGGTGDSGANTKHATQFEALKTEYDKLKNTVNNLVSAFNSHMHATAGTGAPSPPTAVPGVIPATADSSDITPAKLTKIKVE